MQPRHSRLIALSLFALVACGGDDDPAAPDTLPRETVAGIYTLTELSFDPQGSLEEKDLLPRLDPGFLPELVVARTSNTFQLAFRNPTSGTIQTVDGLLTLLESGVRLDFPVADTIASKLLFPGRMTFVYEEEPEPQLVFDQGVSVPLARLRELVPEFADEPLASPVPGRLQVTFTLRER